MAHFYRYETKPLKIKFTPTNVLQDYKHVIVSIGQNGTIVNKTEADDGVEIDEALGIVNINLTQEETGRFNKGEAIVQVNIYYDYKERDVSVQSNISVRDNLYKKVIKDE